MTFLALFLLATFLGALVSGLAGFAMGVVMLGIWAHILTPVQSAVLIVGYGLLTQTYGIWKLRHAFRWHRVAPFIIGGALGVPVGAMLLAQLAPAYLRSGVGVLIVLYGVYGLARPALKPLQAGTPADLAIGMLNGLVAGLTGLIGIIVTVWCQLRGWSKDETRSVFQPVNLAVAAMSAAAFGFAGVITGETVQLFLVGAPVLLAGLWAGFKLYGKLDEIAFRKVIFALLLVSGLALLLPQWIL
jgi:uncharacterized membrane protein YfcA